MIRALILAFISLAVISCSPKLATIELLVSSINCHIERSTNANSEMENELYFIITNNSDRSIYIEKNPELYIDGVKTGGFDILIEDQDGIEIERFDGVSLGSGRVGIAKVDPQKELAIPIGINNYKFQKDKVYAIEVSKELTVYLATKKGASLSSTKEFKKVIKFDRIEKFDYKL